MLFWLFVSSSLPFGFPASVHSISSALHHHHSVMLLREVATCFSSKLSVIFFKSYLNGRSFCLLQDSPRIMNHLPTHHPRWTSNPLSSCFLTCRIRSVIGTHLHHWSRPPRCYGHPSYRADKLLDVYPSDAGGFISHLLDTCRLVYGIGQDSVKIAYHLEAFRYSASFGNPALQNRNSYFFQFYSDFGSGHFGAFLHWGGHLVIRD